MKRIGYVRMYQQKSDIEYKIVSKRLKGFNNVAINTEHGNNKILYKIIDSVDADDEVMLYVATILSLGRTHIDRIDNLAKIKEKPNIHIYFIDEEIDTSKTKIDSIIKLLENLIWKTTIRRGRPNDALNEEAYSLFCEKYPTTQSKTKLASEIGVSRSTIYRYIKKYEYLER